jgi:hypothetical protein
MLFGAFIINVEIFTNRLTHTSQKIGTHPTIRVSGEVGRRAVNRRLVVLHQSDGYGRGGGHLMSGK